MIPNLLLKLPVHHISPVNWSAQFQSRHVLAFKNLLSNKILPNPFGSGCAIWNHPARTVKIQRDHAWCVNCTCKLRWLLRSLLPRHAKFARAASVVQHDNTILPHESAHSHCEYTTSPRCLSCSLKAWLFNLPIRFQVAGVLRCFRSRRH